MVFFGEKFAGGQNFPQFAPQSVGTVAASRFAPSPNGRLHIGHAFAALCAHDFARGFGGDFRLRIEDIDGVRSRPEHVAAIIKDLRWLGLEWDGAVAFQSQNLDRYQAGFERLKTMGLVYRCFCSRADIAAALKLRPVPHGPDGPAYPGTCRGRDGCGEGAHCWRLDMAKAMALINSPSPSGEGSGWGREVLRNGETPPPAPPLKGRGGLIWTDLAAGSQMADPMRFGDVVLWRKDAPASYHLAATLDDAADGISHVVRGRDLFAYTDIHRILQALLGLPTPVYWHHPLLLDAKGEKLAKSRLSQPLGLLRDSGIDGKKLVDALRKGELPLGIARSDT